jgi:hypothetical protein
MKVELIRDFIEEWELMQKEGSKHPTISLSEQGWIFVPRLYRTNMIFNQFLLFDYS